MRYTVGLNTILKLCCVNGFYLFPLDLRSAFTTLLFLNLALVMPFLICHLAGLCHSHCSNNYVSFDETFIFILLAV